VLVPEGDRRHSGQGLARRRRRHGEEWRPHRAAISATANDASSLLPDLSAAGEQVAFREGAEAAAMGPPGRGPDFFCRSGSDVPEADATLDPTTTAASKLLQSPTVRRRKSFSSSNKKNRTPAGCAGTARPIKPNHRDALASRAEAHGADRRSSS